MGADTSFEVSDRVTDAQLRQIAQLIERVVEVDGVRPFSDHAMVHLMNGSEATHTHDERHVLAWRATTLVGYGHLDMSDAVEGPSAQLAVDPAIRRGGIGGRLLDLLVAESRGQLKLWAHGAHDTAGGLAESRHFTKVRALLRMQTSLARQLPAADLAAGYRIRTYEPGLDDAEWLAVNARAFAALPDQGNWTQRELDLRLAEPWFDPRGFLLAVDASGRIVGFHWTKIHDGGSVGEIYVLGIEPAASGHHLGRSLAILGMEHLKSLELTEAMLYVDDMNSAAVAMYTDLGFRKFDTDILYVSQ